jgi:hypothetical protein
VKNLLFILLGFEPEPEPKLAKSQNRNRNRKKLQFHNTAQNIFLFETNNASEKEKQRRETTIFNFASCGEPKNLKRKEVTNMQNKRKPMSTMSY